MARSPAPIRPRRADERAYETALRRTYLNPMFIDLRRRLAGAEAANQAWRAMDDFVERMTAQPKAGVPVHEIQAALDRMKGYHRKRVIDSFRAALALDIRGILTEPEISIFMAQKLSDNVDLIKTIPTRMHAALKARLERELRAAPFDQQVLTRVVRTEYGSSGYNLRRIVRDQTSKTIAGLTEVRQRQLGVDGYEWLTSQDERVRATHVANSGRFFLWSKPPTETGHPGDDVQCRCVAVPVVTDAARKRLQERAGATSTTERDLYTPPVRERPARGTPPVSPAPPPAPPTPAPPPPPLPKTWAEANEVANRPARERDWHEASWGHASGIVLQAIGRVPRLRNIGVRRGQKSGAHYGTEERYIYMGPDRPIETGHGRGVWRHEYGHHMDRMRKGDKNWASQGARYESARKADAKGLVKHWGKDRTASTANVKKWDDAAAEIVGLPDAQRRELVDNMMESAGLKRDDVVAFLTREGPLGAGESVWPMERDAILWRFAKAWKERDGQGMANLLAFTREPAALIRGIGRRRDVQRWVRDNTGNGKAFSDLMDAMSHGRVHAGWRHSEAYYAKHPEFRNAEIFANQISIMGESPMGELLLERFTPKLYANTRRIIAGFKGKGK